MRSLAMLFIACSLNAAPVGNTAAPMLIEKGIFTHCDSWLNFRAGYEGDFVTDGRMKQFDQGFGRVDCYVQDTNSGTVTFNIRDRLDMYGVFGSSKTRADWRFPSGEMIHRIELDTEYNFLWAVGARAILYQWCNTFFGVGGRYSASHYETVSATQDGIAEPVDGSQFHWCQWQINFDLAYKIDLLTPYIGFKYSNERTLLTDFSFPIASDGSGSNSFENRVPVGLYLGCSLSNGKYFMLNIEGRLIDEEAVTITGDLRF